MNPAEVNNYILQLNETVPVYLQTLSVPEQPGRFLPCVNGVKKRGRRVALGFSCFALKVYYMLGPWDALDPRSQAAWLAFLKSFQTPGHFWQHHVFRHTFIDPAVLGHLQQQMPRYQRVMQQGVFSKGLTHLHKTVLAETKQTLATLMQVGAAADRPFRGFPLTQKGIRHYMLKTTSWTRPWGAGGHTSALAVFLKIEAPKLVSFQKTQSLLDICSQIFGTLVDKETGAYFTGSKIPEHGQLINGAMKVLTALEWLETPVHYPERLIDTTLIQLPDPEGCHLVDAVYVLYRCLQQTEHRKTDIQQYCMQVLEMIQEHYNPDGGFSYFIGRSQTKYYGVPISKGLAESDIHGTVLLTWAIAMIVKILDSNVVNWRVIKP